MKNLKYAVLGSNGFIGSHMVNFLKKKNYDVKEVSGVDLRVYKNVLKALKNIDIVFHFAADMGGVGYFSKEQYLPFVNNMQIDINVIKACDENKVKKLFYPSSACAYSPSDKPLEEEMLNKSYKPDQMYGWEKLSIIKLAPTLPFDMRVGVLHTIFGEGQTWKGKKAKFPPQIVYKAIEAMKSKEIEIWGDGNQTRTFLYIDDAIEMIFEIVNSNKYYGPVNISSDEVVTVGECVDWICNYLKIKPLYKFNLNKPTGVMFRGSNNDKFKKYYKHRQKYSTKDGFIKLTEWITKEINKKNSVKS